MGRAWFYLSSWVKTSWNLIWKFRFSWSQGCAKEGSWLKKIGWTCDERFWCLMRCELILVKLSMRQKLHEQCKGIAKFHEACHVFITLVLEIMYIIVYFCEFLLTFWCVSFSLHWNSSENYVAFLLHFCCSRSVCILMRFEKCWGIIMHVLWTVYALLCNSFVFFGTSYAFLLQFFCIFMHVACKSLSVLLCFLLLRSSFADFESWSFVQDMKI